MTRKILRFGRPLNILKQLLDRLKTHEDKGVRMILFRTLSDIALIFYFLLDHPCYINKIGLYKFESNFISNIEWFSDFMWMIEIILDILCDIVDLYAI